MRFREAVSDGVVRGGLISAGAAAGWGGIANAILMKPLQLILGLWLAAVAGGLLVASGQDLKSSRPSRGASPSLSNEGKTPPAVGRQAEGAWRGYVDDTVEILGVTEEKPDATGKRKVTVRVRYIVIRYKEATLTLAFNVKTATEFFRVREKIVQKGSEEVELAAVITPVNWPAKTPFKVQVGLLAEPRPRAWSLLAAATQVMKPAPPLAEPEGAGGKP